MALAVSGSDGGVLMSAWESSSSCMALFGGGTFCAGGVYKEGFYPVRCLTKVWAVSSREVVKDGFQST
jgi:hypothetical protein